MIEKINSLIKDLDEIKVREMIEFEETLTNLSVRLGDLLSMINFKKKRDEK